MAAHVFGQEVLVLQVRSFVDSPEFARLQMTCRTAVVRDVDPKRRRGSAGGSRP